MMLGLSIHEFAHAYAAHKMGDDTARNLGRMTLNPFAHLDLVGTLLLIFAGFGYAKPVPVNPRYYKGNKRVADNIVSLAGITANFFVAITAMFLLHLLIYLGLQNMTIIYMIDYLIIINIALMVFNLIPVYPLDGSHVAENLLIKHIGPEPFMFMRRYRLYITIALILFIANTGIISSAVYAIYNFFDKGFALLFR
jgi:Zn-dependent protease